MQNISRRTALGSVAATALTGLSSKAEAKSANPQKSSANGRQPVRSMTLEEFQQMETPIDANDLFHQIEGHSFSMCHKDMRDVHGIWIPELVPIFEKMDSMRATAR